MRFDLEKTPSGFRKMVPVPDKSPDTPQDKPFPFLSLPNELIRDVFIYSQNFNLALVNQRLHNLLIDPTTLLDFCIMAFTPDGTPHDPLPYVPEPLPSREIYSSQTAILEAPWFDSTFALAVQSRIPRLDAAAKQHAEAGLKGRLPADTRPGPNMHTNRMLSSFYVKMPRKVMCLPWTEEKDAMFGILRSWDVELWPTTEDMARLDGLITEMVAQGKMDHATALDDYRSAWQFQFHPLF